MKIDFSIMNLIKKINKHLNREALRLLEAVRTAAIEGDVSVYLVGGVVRDLLLEVPCLDIDIAVEGDAPELARKLAGVEGTTVHPGFGTSTIRWNRLRVDLVTARSETYAAPGALPEISPDNIKADLYRRDFTINAMAVSLNHANYGDLVDPYEGYTDLKNGLIRIIHDNSFIDDATRIWRAIRYEQRLNFKIERSTLNMLKTNIEKLHTISGDRIRHELELVLKEKFPEKVLLRAHQLGVLSTMYPSLGFPEGLTKYFIEARELGLSDSALVTVYLILLFDALNIEELDIVTSRLHYNRLVTKALGEVKELKEKLPQLAMGKIANSDIYFLLHEYSPLPIIAISILTESPVAAEHIDIYLTRLKNVKPRLNGDDLKKLGIADGPEIKKVLRMLLAARLDGNVSTKQSEIRTVYAWLGLDPNKV